MSERVNVPMQNDLLHQIDEWRRQQRDIPNRGEAIRRLIRRAPDITETGTPERGTLL